LAAFLFAVDRLLGEEPPPEAERCRVLYVSPLKALTVDVERNLRAPLRGIRWEAERLGAAVADLRVAVRTGDTPAADRRDIERHPPDILITTPESLFLMLTSAARRILASVRWVIVDEIHSVAATKRGAHLSLSLERLAALARADPQRVGLSATQRPLEEVGRFLGGVGRDVAVVDAGEPAGRSGRGRGLRELLEVRVEVPVEDMADLERGSGSEWEPSAGGAGPPPADGTQPPQQRSIWTSIHPRILELVRSHRSTIVFVNSRRLAERLAARLNELAGEEIVRAHHGSIAREQRTEIEDALKAGRLPGLVATSSLELGIDMGAVDLVVQVEAPPTVAAGIQRIGRAGHQVGERSRGVVFPKFRGDLLAAAAVVSGMLDGAIETTRVQRVPLDVLAQQIVAMTALDTWAVADLAATVRRAYPFAELGDRALESVLDMLAGAYPADEFAELRPRIVWDRIAGTIRGRAGAQRLAVTSGGTIPDRGLFPVVLLDGGEGPTARKVGELDEEMVYEMRPGDVFVLGATSWRVADITAQRVEVVPAPGEPGRVAFWHGDAVGRPVEVGRLLGAMLRDIARLADAPAAAMLRERAGFDERAATNLVAYVRDQQQATGSVPDDRTVVVERFRDQLGDWRLCVLTPLGARVHAPWAIAVTARLRGRLGSEVQSIHTDDGFAVRLPDVDEPPGVEDLLVDPEEIDELVTEQLAGSALFGARFRENASRALLLPRRRPGERTPLWKQRQRSADLLQVAGRHPSFPILVETYRECLADVFDMPALRDLLSRLRSGETRLSVSDTPRASPFSSSLVFDYIAQYMYEGDQPLAERRAQALSLDRELLAELLGSAELRELLDPEAIGVVELELQGLLRERWPRDADEAHDLLRRLGDLDDGECAARGVRPEWLAGLAQARRAVELRIAGDRRWVAVEDAALFRDAVGASLPIGLPEAHLAPSAEPLQALLLRYARVHVPFSSAEPARRLGVPVAALEAQLEALAGRGAVLSGEFRPGRSGREWCHPEVLRALRRRSLAALRREAEAVAPEVLARFLPAWHGVGSQAAGVERLLEVLAQLEGAAVPATALEPDILPARVAGYRPELLDELTALGEVAWVGRGRAAGGDGRVALHLRGEAHLLVPVPAAGPDGPLHDHIRARLEEGGAAFFQDLLAGAPSRDVEELVDALWDLVWAGEVTNDSLAPLRAAVSRARRGAGRAPARRPLMRLAPPSAQGRWSLTRRLREPVAAPTARLHATAAMLLRRHGVLVREAALAEAIPGGFATLYPVLRAMEEAGRVRRGYFVEGLGGAQFALPGAVDRLRGARDAGGVTLLAAVDPANPYGVTIPWPERSQDGSGRPARTAGAYVVLVDGALRLYVERGGRSIVTVGGPPPDEAVAVLAEVARRRGRLDVETVDGVPVQETPLLGPLRAAGFSLVPRGLVAWGERRPVPARS
ncbi:MAG TPA: DEAD/DEAH box helicase, partial [Candidatus Dormibacteraeota bacterium]|nr:DEAD/DEAH box helicase [Candidatus Dormibacteraeota bacterium]